MLTTQSETKKIEALIREFPCEQSFKTRLLDPQLDKFQCQILQTAIVSNLEDRLPFEIIGESGTADELISPYTLNDDWPAQLKSSFKNIIKLIEKLVAESGISDVAIVFSEGYDINYELLSSNIYALEKLLFDKFHAEGRVPSLAIKVRINGG